MFFINGHVLQRGPHAGEHAEELLDGAHATNGFDLRQEIVHGHAAFGQLDRHFLGLCLVNLVASFLHQRNHVAHAQNSTSHALGVEVFELVAVFSNPQMNDGGPRDAPD